MSPLDAFDQNKEGTAAPEPPDTEERRTVDKSALEARFSGYEVVDHAHVRLTPVVLRDASNAAIAASTRLAHAASHRYGRRP